MNIIHNQGWRDRRAVIFIAVAALLFGAFEVRLFYLQVIGRPDFVKMAASNRLRADVIEPLRGRILDRNGVLMVENRPSYTLYGQPAILRDTPGVTVQLASMLQITDDEVRSRIAKQGWFTFTPAALQRDLSWDALAALEAQQIDLPGIMFRLDSKRSYLVPEAVHLLGYVGERETAPVSGRARYNLVGKRGLEKIYEKYLGGEPGVKYLEVDSKGRLLGVAKDRPFLASEPGWDLQLNIDAGLQRYASELMASRTGAVVALDPRDGGVIVLLSQPDYDPDLFSSVMSPEVWQQLGNDPEHPLLNRAIQGVYPPGSTFKMVGLCAALSEGVVGDDSRVSCPGGLQIGNRWFSCWNHGGHGSLNPIEALQHSCDVFFYTMGLRLGVDRLNQYALDLGLGAKTGVDLDGESAGLVAGREYLDKKFGAGGWSRALAANIAIGQGDVLTTPIQLAVYAGAIATGSVATPHIARRFVHPVTQEDREIEPELRPVTVPPQVLLRVREAMRRVVNEPGGTAFWLHDPDIVIAGKTGTSQNPNGKDHALFVAYAPFDNPVIAVAVVVEHGEHGSSAAAPVACKLIHRYLKGDEEHAADSTAAAAAATGVIGD